MLRRRKGGAAAFDSFQICQDCVIFLTKWRRLSAH